MRKPERYKKKCWALVKGPALGGYKGPWPKVGWECGLDTSFQLR